MSIFRGNDIRGVYGDDLTERDAASIAHAFVRFLNCKEVIVARDHRVSSPALSRAIIEGLRDAGASVIDIGIIDSPGLYFASNHLQKPAIMVTASHNPPQHNGFYLCDKGARIIYSQNGLKEIEQLVHEGNFKSARKRGAYAKRSLWKEYEQHILSLLDGFTIKPLKVVIDAGNGVGGLIAQRIYAKFPQISLVPLFFTPDGRFPHRNPDTSVPRNLRELGARVRAVGADFGCAFDGDADRVAFVDERGRPILDSISGTLLTHLLLKQRTRSKEAIVYSTRCTRALPELISAYGGVPTRERVGHSFMSARMRALDALFGVENTGHYFYRSNFYTESPILSSLLMCSLVSHSQVPISSLIKPFKKYYMTPEVNFSLGENHEVLARLEKPLRAQYHRPIDRFDGLSVDCGEFWFSIRESQTESKLRLTLEGVSKSKVNQEKARLLNLIKRVLSQSN